MYVCGIRWIYTSRTSEIWSHVYQRPTRTSTLPRKGGQGKVLPVSHPSHSFLFVCVTVFVNFVWCPPVKNRRWKNQPTYHNKNHFCRHSAMERHASLFHSAHVPPISRINTPNFSTLPLENHHFDSKITLRRSKTPLCQHQKTIPQTKNTPNPADLTGKTPKLYKEMPRRLKKTITPEKLPTYVCSYSGRKNSHQSLFFRAPGLLLLLFYVHCRREREREKERKKPKWKLLLYKLVTQ